MKRKSILLFLVMFLTLPVTSHAFDLGQVIGSAIGGAGMLASAAKSITPSEEHYIGRSVCAMVLSKYSIYSNVALTKYINEVGLSLAYVSERPATFGGYHFAVLNSNEPNAYACPGGMILINKGLLKQIENEDQLAAVLGHEVAHVAARDGINTIKKSRWTKLGFYAAGEAGKQYSSGNVAELVGTFQGVVTDVAKKVIDSGYSKGDEKKADIASMRYAWKAGYNPAAMVDFIKAEEAKGHGHSVGPFSSHPKPAQRIKSCESELKKLGGPTPIAKVRTNRYKRMTASVR
jgi:predicted Zn-dependent protease